MPSHVRFVSCETPFEEMIPDSDNTGEGDVTRLLERWRSGEAEAIERLMPIVYDELHRIAHGRLWGERNGHTLNTTDLVHEAFINLVDHHGAAWNNRSRFFAAAARVTLSPLASST